MISNTPGAGGRGGGSIGSVRVGRGRQRVLFVLSSTGGVHQCVSGYGCLIFLGNRNNHHERLFVERGLKGDGINALFSRNPFM